MSRRAVAAIAALILAGGAVAGGIATTASNLTDSNITATDSTADQIATPAAVAIVPPVPVTTTTVRPSQTASTTTSTTTPVTPTTSTAPATPMTPPTLATPIVTYAADIGVLAPTDVAAPEHVIIPTLDIDGPVIAAGVNVANELDVPPDARTLVWYRHGPSPGEPGSAVIAGHLNWRGVNGLFARLAETPVGASITVVYDDGSEQAFTVSTVELVPKPAVAVNGVFARGGERLLRLVTCGGEFEEDIRSYRSNVIVTAVPA